MLESLFSVSLHRTICTILVFALIMVLIYKDDKSFFTSLNFKWLSLLIFIFYVLFFGFRPTRFLNESNDTTLYTVMFEYVKSGHWTDNLDKLGEPFFRWIELLCAKRTDATGWYIVIASFYMGGMAFSTFRLLSKHTIIATAFFITSFCFMAYGGNGIRNGMATSIALIGLTIVSLQVLDKKKLPLIVGFLLLVLSVFTHRSMVLVVIIATIAFFIMKNVKFNLLLWLICVVVAAVFGNYLTPIFTTLTGDERAIYYAMSDIDISLFSKTGFRWDFVLYSSLPIILASWTSFFGKPVDKTYDFLINTYILTNAFWVLINQIAYSNRFAYLSWFMMPIVLAYPLCKIQMVKHQSLLCALFLVVQLGLLYVF